MVILLNACIFVKKSTNQINAVDLKLTSFNYKVKICCFLSSRWLFFFNKTDIFKPDTEPGGEKTTVPM